MFDIIAGLKVKEQEFTYKDTISASEAFISSTTKHVLPVSTLDNNIIANGKPGKITSQVAKLYKQYIANQIILNNVA